VSTPHFWLLLLTAASDLEQALYASKIISYAQGFMLMREAAKVNDWTLNNAGIAAMWRGGCIIKVSMENDPIEIGLTTA